MAKQFNIRLPEMSHEQINRISENHGLTKTQVIILAVDRFATALEASDRQAEHEVKRLKTVARVAPQVDLGQV